ncbi:putative Lysine methyltransferase [Paratrimastix pyriformis]|uniref:Lysine methyltransferase n=1 Tax=Paratrimastix pyriformis TaxID=342808 RepID=A0ABQ8UQY7_9EUKA|nr:putative Lysine methyltransferase [Paratrimastix pyriformis]
MASSVPPPPPLPPPSHHHFRTPPKTETPTLTIHNPKFERVRRSLLWRGTHAALPEYLFRCANGDNLRIRQILGGVEKGLGTGAALWDAALLIARFFECHPGGYEGEFVVDSDTSRAIKFAVPMVSSARWVELGAGTSLAGFAAAHCGVGRVVCTDLPVLLPLIRENIALNQSLLGGRVVEAAYDWAMEPPSEVAQHGPFDVVLVCECVYHAVPELLLVKAILALTRPAGGKQPVVLMAYEHRSEHIRRRFFDLFTRHFYIHCIPHEDHHPDFEVDDINLYVMVPRPDQPALPADCPCQTAF